MRPDEIRHLAAIVASSDDAIISKTLDGVITSWNFGAERMFGYAASEAIGRSITMLFPPDRIHEEETFIAEIRRGGRVEHFETVRVRKDGRAVDVSVTLSPLHDDAGRIVGVSKIARNITERIALAARERAALRAAEEANRVKDDFLAMLSHELRTPLTAVAGWIRMMRSGALDADRLRHGLEVADRNCQAQLAIINDLLDFSAVHRGQARLTFADVDVGTVVRDAVETIRPTADSRGVALTVIAPSVRLRGDARRLQQVLWNLVSNAVKFTPAGGKVTIELARGEGVATVTVRDTGVGIPAAALPHVFEAFRQADSSTTRRFGGLGLGLSLVRSFVELHGGTVSAQSEGPGEGATFVVTLPLPGQA